jgi:hypothetical protein
MLSFVETARFTEYENRLSLPQGTT